jgi:hypothetical protein
MTYTSNTFSSNTNTHHTPEDIVPIKNLYIRVRQALSWAKEDIYNYQDEFQAGLDILHELIQHDAFVDEDSRLMVIEFLEGYSSQIEEKSPFKNNLIRKLLHEIKHQND